MSKFDLFSLTECFKRISSEWGLELIEIDTGNHVSKAFTISVITLGTVASASVLASLLLEEQFEVNATLGADDRTVTLDMSDYTATSTDLRVIERRIASKLVATIFAPLFRPNKEFQNLSQLSVIAAINICSYLSAVEQCQLAQTNQSFRSTASADVVWNKLVASDFPKAAVMNISFAAPTSGTANYNNTNSGEGTAKLRYRKLYLQRTGDLRKVKAAEQRCLESLEKQRLHLLRRNNKPSCVCS